MWKLELQEMMFYAYHGCLEREQIIGNTFKVDFTAYFDMGAAGESDELDDTINYGIIYDIIAKEMSTPSKLLEHLAQRIVRAISNAFPQIESMEVRVAKRNPPVNGPTAWSAITLKTGLEF